MCLRGIKKVYSLFSKSLPPCPSTTTETENVDGRARSCKGPRTGCHDMDAKGEQTTERGSDEEGLQEGESLELRWNHIVTKCQAGRELRNLSPPSAHGEREAGYRKGLSQDLTTVGGEIRII
ncbi:hypothetical protein HJG60_008766 [Phyllostomus discolor]|uniref:Uncharacterized protein n=1 Tax=Phyllostomus discolor TaxID=89673 RepID=A0A833YSF7_9CHIR|nr:hypothetical protein HJG60_008766 [Phyllostomus discolor]